MIDTANITSLEIIEDLDWEETLPCEVLYAHPFPGLFNNHRACDSGRPAEWVVRHNHCGEFCVLACSPCANRENWLCRTCQAELTPDEISFTRIRPR